MKDISICILVIDRDINQSKSIARIFSIIDRNCTSYPIEFNDETFQIPPLENIDIVICDKHLPLDFHDQIMQNFKYSIPRAIRVTTTDTKENDVIGSAATLSQFVIIKPIEQNFASKIIDSLNKINSLGLSNDFFEKVNLVETSCSQPDVIVKLREKLKSNDYGLNDLVDIISHDPVLSAKIIAVSNTAYFGYSRITNSLADAVNRIGVGNIDAICSYLLLHHSCSNQVQHDIVEHLGDLAFQTSKICKEICKLNKFNTQLVEDCQASGFLSFIGEIFTAISPISEKSDLGPFSYLEISDAVGAYLLLFWEFPEEQILINLELNNFEYTSENGDLMKSLEIVRYARSVVSKSELLPYCRFRMDKAGIIYNL